MEAYYRGVELYSCDDSWEGAFDLMVHTGLVGIELAHLYPFRAKLSRALRLAELTNVEVFRERFERFPMLEKHSCANVFFGGLA